MGKMLIGVILGIILIASCATSTRITVTGTAHPVRTDEPRIALSDTLGYTVSTHSDKRVTLQTVEPTRTADGDFALDFALDAPSTIDKVYVTVKAYGDQPVVVWGSSHLVERNEQGVFVRGMETDIPFAEIRWFELTWNAD